MIVFICLKSKRLICTIVSKTAFKFENCCYLCENKTTKRSLFAYIWKNNNCSTALEIQKEMQQIIATNAKHLTNMKEPSIFLNDCSFIEKSITIKIMHPYMKVSMWLIFSISTLTIDWHRSYMCQKQQFVGWELFLVWASNRLFRVRNCS